MRIPTPATIEPMVIKKQRIDGLYKFAFSEVNGTLHDIYEMEISESPDKAYDMCVSGLGAISPKALSNLSSAMGKADSYASKEVVANLVYRLINGKDDDKAQLSLLVLHSETIVDLMDTRCQHVYEAEPLNLIYNVVNAALNRRMSEVSIEVQTEAALTLGIMFPCEYFHDNHKLVRSMIDQRDKILEHHERIIDSADHIRQRNEIDVELLLDMDKHFGAIRIGTL